MRARDVDDRGVSILVEYLILMGILSVFVVVMTLQLHDTLSEVQIVRVMENNFADVASQISAIYTDYVLILPSNGTISTNIRIPSSIGGKIDYTANFESISNLAFIKVEGRGVSTVSGLGLAKYISNDGRAMRVNASGDVLSMKAESESEKPEVKYEKSLECPFIPKPRLQFIPASVALNENVVVKISFQNPEDIKSAVRWKITLWNGTTISGTTQSGSPIHEYLTVNDISGCSPRNGYDYECPANVSAEVAERPDCNGTNVNKLLVSSNPRTSNPYLVYEKWVEPRIVAPGSEFEAHLRLEGRGFFVEGATNLSVVHIIDVSGSMIQPAIFKNYSFTVNPNVVKETFNLSQSGKLEIYAYTTDRLPDWYSNRLCKCTGSECPWWNKGYDSSFIQLYLNGNIVGTAYSSGSAIGKRHTVNNAQSGNYTLEVVARAPEQINLTIRVVFKGNTLIEKTIPYTNRAEVSFELPEIADYRFLAVSGVQNIPNWDMSYSSWYPRWSDYTRIEDYTVSGYSRYWEYRWRLCGDKSYTFQDGNLNVWLLLPNGSKEFLLKGENSPWYQARNNYGTNGIDGDVFIPNPPKGTYKFVIVPTTKNPVTFTVNVLIKRIDAAKLAAITFNSMLGSKDFIGIANFSTDAQRIAVNSSPLRFMTNDKSVVNNIVKQLRAELATDHADGLYYGSSIFPIWNETGNNCTECIAGLRPLIIVLTDGEPTICNRNTVYYYCNLCNQDCSGGSWCEPCKNQALCIANYLKNNVKINDFNVSICTIGFGTDIGSRGQEFLRQLASPRPDNNEPCYFFAETSEELVEAYRTIFNAFQIAAKQIIVHETLNVSLSLPFKFLNVNVISNKGSPVSLPEVIETETNTVIKVNVTSIQKDEVLEVIVKLRVKEDAPPGEYDINDDDTSFIEYTALDYAGNEVETIKLPIYSVRDKIMVVSGEDARIILR